MINIRVNEDNVLECWKLYEQYVDEFHKEHYSDASYEDFVTWCEDELGECSNCGQIVWKEKQEHLIDGFNTDEVCDDCIESYGYYE